MNERQDYTLREVIEMKFAAQEKRHIEHRQHVDTRFDQIQKELREERDHTHGDKVGWAAFAALAVALIGLAIGAG